MSQTSPPGQLNSKVPNAIPPVRLSAVVFPGSVTAATGVVGFADGWTVTSGVGGAFSSTDGVVTDAWLGVTTTKGAAGVTDGGQRGPLTKAGCGFDTSGVAGFEGRELK